MKIHIVITKVSYKKFVSGSDYSMDLYSHDKFFSNNGDVVGPLFCRISGTVHFLSKSPVICEACGVMYFLHTRMLLYTLQGVCLVEPLLQGGL